MKPHRSRRDNRGMTGLLALFLLSVCIYLFVHAPPPLPEHGAGQRHLSANSLLKMVAAEQESARALYTREIVGKGLAVGLAFDEDWRQPEVEAGPLPALFLREIAVALQRDPVPLGLFLGSDEPINSSNQFTGLQLAAFVSVRKSGNGQYFFSEDLNQFVAMFPDRAVAEACVSCHNEHPDSPKQDWQRGEIMGATTWSYPHERVSIENMLSALVAIRKSIGQAYDLYLKETASFAQPPEIGQNWPRDGFYLPGREVFLGELAKRSSATSLFHLMETGDGEDP